MSLQPGDGVRLLSRWVVARVPPHIRVRLAPCMPRPTAWISPATGCERASTLLIEHCELALVCPCCYVPWQAMGKSLCPAILALGLRLVPDTSSMLWGVGMGSHEWFLTDHVRMLYRSSIFESRLILATPLIVLRPRWKPVTLEPPPVYLGSDASHAILHPSYLLQHLQLLQLGLLE